MENGQISMFKQPKEKILKELTPRIVENVKYLCNRKNIKVSEVEDFIQAKHGYFTSAKNKDNSPSIEKVVLTAQLLQVSVDDLCFNDFERTEIQAEIESMETKIREMKRKLEGKK